MVELASIGGVAIVQAMATDAWITARSKVAGLLCRGNGEHSARVLAELDSSRETIVQRPSDQNEQREVLLWTARLRDLLLEAPESVAFLEELIDSIAPAKNESTTTTATQHISVGRDAYIAGRDLHLKDPHQNRS